MIPLTRRRLVLCSRQSLPRPARYSTPSKRNNAPALGTATAPQPELPAFMSSASAPAPESNLPYEDMQGFLQRRVPYTLLPTPLPEKESSPLNDLYFTDSPTQDSVSVIDACLHNLHDVPRAQAVFSLLRRSAKGEGVLTVRLYNTFLAAYLELASTATPAHASRWVEEASELYQVMESGMEKVHPTANTYALMTLIWLRFNPDSRNPVGADVPMHDPTALLRCIIDRQIPVSMVISDRSFASSDEAAEAIQQFSRAAVEMNLSKVVSELGLAQSLGSQLPDPLLEVPEASPVLRPKVRQPEVSASFAEDGSVTELVSSSGEEHSGEVEYEVPFNLDNLRKHLAQVVLARRVLPHDAAARQKLLEESVYDVAVERLKHQAQIFEELGLGDKGLGNLDLRAWMWEWHQKLQGRLKAEIAETIRLEENLRECDHGKRLGPFLSLVKPEKLSLITILELMHLQGTGGVVDGMKTARALLAVGKAVEMEYKAEMCKKNNIAIPTVVPGRVDANAFFSRLGYRDLHARRVAARKYMEDSEEWTSDWTQLVRVRVGSFLVDALMDVATVTRTATDRRTGEALSEEQPAFFHSYEYIRGQKLGVIKLNPVVSERIAKDALRETLHPRHLPMLVKPKPWLTHDQGGYLYNKTSAMRYKDSQEQLSYLRHASNLGNVELVYAGLDVLGSTPWKINRAIFDVVLEVWNTGGRLCKIPPATFDEPEPEKPDNFDTDPKARSVFLQRHKQYAQTKANNHSERCNVNYKIEIARTFLGDTIYLPHNVDFRGRAYPIPPHLNHIGDDLSRGLLKFGEARPLGERGLRWLKIHLANLYGFDKGSFDERVNFVHEHLEDIYDSADKPLEGKRWWTKADDPWQCLATCIELRDALESGNPLEFESSLPVHQDGTCNGLQHYAALGGDAQGAQQVNLGVTDRPSDVYTYVANMVEKSLLVDKEAGNRLAALLSGKISRKVVKQTVMTTVYGVTFVGARDQIEKQLRDSKQIPPEDCWTASSYVAKKVLACIGDLFSGAKDIQNWLNLSARIIAKSIPPERLSSEESGGGSGSEERTIRPIPIKRLKKEQMTSVIWTTPLGLPIVQPYRQVKRKQVMTSLQTVFISDPNSPAVVNSTKQATAFPPNFIHSLDATHMMLTALECRTQGITFASVHDSYWTHASSVDEMSAVIRDTFIALHSSDVLRKLYEEWQERYKGYKIPWTSLRGHFMDVLAEHEKKHRVVPEGAPASEKDIKTKVAELLSGQDKAALEGNNDATQSAVLDQLDESEADADEDGDVEAAPKKKRLPKRRKSELAEFQGDDSETDDRFLDVVDLLPSLPLKGAFDVKTIKGSLYFFS